MNDGKHQHDFVQHEEGICRCIISGGHEATSHSLKTLTSITKDCMVAEPKIVQKFGDRGTDQYSVRDIAHTIPANPMSDRGQMLLEPKIRQMGRGFNKGNLHNICPTITSNSFECNNFVINYIPFIPKTIDVQRLRLELLAKRKNITNYRIRKLTPRECFRLMGVDDADIDKIQLYPFGADIEYPAYSHKERLANMSEEEKRVLMRKGISNSQQYKLAGNSIVVDVLYHIFRTMFVDKPTKQVKQLTLF